jgi:FkbM family methyltransferase
VRAIPQSSAAGLGRNLFLHTRPADVDEERAIKFRLRNGQHVTLYGSVRTSLNEVFLHKIYDVPGVDFSQCRHVFDVGAQAGVFAVYVASQAPCTAITCFEASSANFTLLQRNLIANTDCAWPHRMAVSATRGRRRFMPAAVADTQDLEELDAEPEMVEHIDLGGIFNMTGVEECDFLKMDVEGEELPILLDTPLELLRRVRAMALQWHYTEETLAPVRLRLGAAGFHTRLDRFGYARNRLMLKAWRT